MTSARAADLAYQLVLADTRALGQRVEQAAEPTERIPTLLAVLGLDRDEEPDRCAVPLDDECLAAPSIVVAWLLNSRIPT